MLMTDFHIHIQAGSFPSPHAAGMNAAEALRRASLCGLRAVGLIVRTDGSDLDGFAPLASRIRALSLYANVEAFAGVELVHVPPALLPETVREAREHGAELVIVHGETLADDVEVGTNLAAVEAGADILAHPGLVDDRVAAYAAEKGVALELSACPRHCLSNAWTAIMAHKAGCLLTPGSDALTPGDLANAGRWERICLGAAMTDAMREHFRDSASTLTNRLMAARKETKEKKERFCA